MAKATRLPYPNTPANPISPYDRAVPTSEEEFGLLDQMHQSSPSKSTTTSQASNAPNAHTVRAALNAHQMRYNRKEAFDKGLKEEVMSIINGKRSSAMRQESFKEIEEYRDREELSNEATYFSNLPELVFGKGRMIKVREDQRHVNEISGEGEGETQNQKKKESWMWQSFLAAGMSRPSQNQKMARGYLPAPPGKEAGLTDPKPDWVYGMKEQVDWEPGKAPSKRTRELISLNLNVAHPSFVIEGKGYQGTISEARNQALRDGSALVNARMMFNDLARDEMEEQPFRPVGPDYDSYCFSSTWDITIAELWVHWYQTLQVGQQGIFHMHCLGQFNIGRQEEATMFRSNVHNILDWMIYIDVPKREALLPLIKEKEDSEEAIRSSYKSIRGSSKSKVAFASAFGSSKQASSTAVSTAQQSTTTSFPTSETTRQSELAPVRPPLLSKETAPKVFQAAAARQAQATSPAWTRSRARAGRETE